MNKELLQIREMINRSSGENSCEAVSLYPGIDLLYMDLKSASFSVRHDAAKNIMQINYCRSGQMVWEMPNGRSIYLNPGDFSLHTMNACAVSAITLPTGRYTGLMIGIDLNTAAACPPDPLGKTDLFRGALQDRFCPDDTVSFLAGNEQTELIFSGFYQQPESLRLAYQKIKTVELLLYLCKLDRSQNRQLTAYQAEQIEIVRKIHDQLTEKIGERITIEELSRQYLINPTTLKAAFKSVYGDPIAAHIKEHRMKKAAELLLESDLSIAKIAQAVGYDSQSRFTAAFKSFFRVVPKEYRKKNSQLP